MLKRHSHLAVTVLLLLPLLGAACARRPALTASGAPAPTGAAGGSAVTPGVPPGGTPATATTRAGSTARGSRQTAAIAERPTVKEFAPVDDLRDVYFEFDRYDIRPDAARVLESNARWLRGTRDLVLIEGHCDERGTNEYNVALGERRAKSAMNYLVAQGVAASRITIVSYGEERPQCAERSESCWSQNRRAHFLVKPQ